MYKSYLKKNINPNTISFLAALAGHLLLLFLLFFKMSSDVPILSFSVSLNDLATSPNNISVTSIITAKDPTKKKSEEVIKNDDLGQQKKVQLKQMEKKLVRKDKIDNLVDSKQQSAVFSKNTPASFDAAYLQNPPPSYPPLSRKLNEQGLVLLSVYVSSSGEAQKVEIVKSSGFFRLDSAALKTVKNWRFVAAKKDQQLVADYVQVPINFILE